MNKLQNIGHHEYQLDKDLKPYAICDIYAIGVADIDSCGAFKKTA